MVRQYTERRLLIGVGGTHRRKDCTDPLRRTQHFQPYFSGFFQLAFLPQKGLCPRLRQKTSLSLIQKGTAAVIALPTGTCRTHGMVHRLRMGHRHIYYQ